MTGFIVKFQVTKTSEKEIKVYADDESEAIEKAEEIVRGWDDVEDCEVIDVEER